MTSHYTNTTSIAYLLLCIFITTATSHSFIREITDDFNTNLHQEAEAEPIQNLDASQVTNDLQRNQEIASRDHKLSASSTVKGLRSRPPSSYSLKMESFNTLLKSSRIEKYESRPFAVGGYNWTLVVYPNGNKKDSGSGYLSLYVAIDNSSFVSAGQEVYADLRFYIFNKNEKKYFTIQDTDVWKFSVFKTMWGFSQVLSLDTFKDPKNGYLYDGDHCEFGVDVTISSLFEKSELFSISDKFSNPRFTWKIQKFSTLLKYYYLSESFTIGGRSWYLDVFPNGVSSVEGKYMSMFINLNDRHKLRPYEKIYVKAKFRVLSRISNVEDPLEFWYHSKLNGRGYNKFVALSDLHDSSKGFLVNDVLTVQFELEALSSTKYFP